MTVHAVASMSRSVSAFMAVRILTTDTRRAARTCSSWSTPPNSQSTNPIRQVVSGLIVPRRGKRADTLSETGPSSKARFPHRLDAAGRARARSHLPERHFGREPVQPDRPVTRLLDVDVPRRERRPAPGPWPWRWPFSATSGTLSAGADCGRCSGGSASGARRPVRILRCPPGWPQLPPEQPQSLPAPSTV